MRLYEVFFDIYFFYDSWTAYNYVDTYDVIHNFLSENEFFCELILLSLYKVLMRDLYKAGIQ